MELIVLGLLAPLALGVVGVLIATVALLSGFMHAGFLIVTGHKP